MTNNDD